MSFELVIFVLGLALAVYGFYRYNTAEINSYNEFVKKAQDLESRMSSLEDAKNYQGGQLVDLRDKVKSLESQCHDAEHEISEAQEHISKVREQQYHQKNQPLVIKFERIPDIDLTGGRPLPVEIITRPQPKVKAVTLSEPHAKEGVSKNNLVNKVKRQMKGLSK